MVSWRRPCSRPGGVGQVRGALAVQVGQQGHRGAGFHGLPVQAQQGRDAVDGEGAVEGAGQGQPVAVRVGEARDRAGRVGGAVLRHGVHGARGAEAEHGVAGAQPEAERGGRVVTGAGGDQRALGERQVMAVAHRPRHLTRPHHPGQHRRVEPDVPQDLLVVRLAPRSPPTCAGGIAPVGGALPGEPLGEVVVGRRTAAVARTDSGSCSASHAHFVTVKEAPGTLPVRSAQAFGPPSSSISRVACGAERTSFHSIAGRTGSPWASRVTSPCCWPPIDTAAASRAASPHWRRASPRASHH